MSKQNFVNGILWAAYALALAASVNHLAWAFGSLEFDGWQWLGWLPALAVDAGLAALAYAIQQRKRARRSVSTLWAGVGMFAGISSFANLLHAMTVQAGIVTIATFALVDALALVKAVLLSATLPVLVLYLGEVVSSDDAVTANEQEQERKRQERKTQPTTPVLPTVGPADPPTCLADSQVADSLTKLAQADNAIAQPCDTLTQANEQRKAQAQEAIDKLLAFYADNPMASQDAAAQVAGRSRQWVGMQLAQMESAGKIKRNGHGVELLVAGILADMPMAKASLPVAN